eukprot:506764-Amphidinium_carterae.1
MARMMMMMMMMSFVAITIHYYPALKMRETMKNTSVDHEAGQLFWDCCARAAGLSPLPQQAFKKAQYLPPGPHLRCRRSHSSAEMISSVTRR